MFFFFISFGEKQIIKLTFISSTLTNFAFPINYEVGVENNLSGRFKSKRD